MAEAGRAARLGVFLVTHHSLRSNPIRRVDGPAVWCEGTRALALLGSNRVSPLTTVDRIGSSATDAASTERMSPARMVKVRVLRGFQESDAMVGPDRIGGVDGVREQCFLERQPMTRTDRLAFARPTQHRVRDRGERPIGRDVGVTADHDADTGLELVAPGLEVMRRVTHDSAYSSP